MSLDSSVSLSTIILVIHLLPYVSHREKAFHKFSIIGLCRDIGNDEYRLTDQDLLGTICAATCRFSAHCCALSLIIEIILFLQLLYIEFMTIIEKLDFF